MTIVRVATGGEARGGGAGVQGRRRQEREEVSSVYYLIDAVTYLLFL
jgi:hypothetical protein